MIMSKALGLILLAFMVGCECPSPTETEDNQAPTMANTNFTVPEDISDTQVIGTLVGSDEDGDPLTYFIFNGDSNLFELGLSNGELSLVEDTNLDFETTNWHVLMAGVTDGRDTRVAQVTVTVTNVDEKDPIVLPRQSFFVNENALLGTSVGKVVASDDVGITRYRITGGNTSNAFAINEINGQLTTASDIDYEGISSYQLTIEVQDAAGRSGRDTVSVNVSDVLLSILNVANIEDDGDLNIYSPYAVTTATVGGNTYLFVAGWASNDGINVFSVGRDGSLVNVTNVDDDDTLHLHRSYSLTADAWGGTTYLFVAGGGDNGVSVFSVSSSGALSNVTNVSDNDTFLQLQAPRGITTALIDSTPYVFVSGFADNGVSVFSVGSNGSLSNVDNVINNDTLELDGAWPVTTAEVEGTTYLFVAGNKDGGVSVFSVGSNGALSNVHNVSDSSSLQLQLKGARHLRTVVEGSTTYLFIAGFGDDGVSVFSVSSGGSLGNVHNVSDSQDSDLLLNDPTSVTTAEVGSNTYLFVTSTTTSDNGVSAFSLSNDGSLINVANVEDSGSLELDGAIAVASTSIGDAIYLFVCGQNDNGVSVFQLKD